MIRLKSPISVIQIDPVSNKTVKIYSSIKQASISMKISQTCIQDCLIGKQKTAAGFKWEKLKLAKSQ